MAQTREVRGVATQVHKTLGSIAVSYHGTLVAEVFLDGRVKLRDGGWKTVTTKLRMNQFANQYVQGAFSISQAKGVWYITKHNTHETLVYEDGIEFYPFQKE
jgi:hypothetical protein